MAWICISLSAQWLECLPVRSGDLPVSGEMSTGLVVTLVLSFGGSL